MMMSRRVFAVSLLPGLAMAAADQSNYLAELKAELARRTAEDRFSGAVLVAAPGRPMFLAAHGMADRERGVPNRLNTRLRFGSLGKMFTGVAVMQLVQAGEVRLDDPLRTYLPDYPNAGVAAVTVHQLLTHTAGTGDIFGPEFGANRLRLKSLQDYVDLYGARDPRFPAGSRFDYSNYGYILLGRMIEVVSGESFAARVRNHIFRPAGMSFTGNLPEEQPVRDRAIPYTTMGDPAQPPAQVPLHSAVGVLPYQGTSAGGGYSTVGDLMRFADALRNYRLLQPHYTDLMLAGKVDTPKLGMRYGYGFEDSRTPDGVRFVGHGGGAPGQNAVISIFPDRGHVVIAMANLDPPSADEIERFIRVRR